MRISDWSSDVCSSDLADEIGRVERDGPAHPGGKSVIHPFHRRADFVRNAHDVRSGSREDPDDQCRLAALGGETAIVPRAKLDARDIAQPDDLAAAFSQYDPQSPRMNSSPS